jgi:penicillin-binding protein 1A
VWFVGGTPDIVGGVYLGYDHPRPLGGYAQGGRISAPIFKQWAQVAFKDAPKVPFVAPTGIRWVRIDRASGKPVFGTFPTEQDPKAQVIWEAFQPQTEPRRSYSGAVGDPYNQQRQEQQLQQRIAQLQQAQAEASRESQSPTARQAPPQPGLPTPNGL